MRHLLYFWLLFHFRLHWHCAVVSSVIVVDACYQYSVEVLIFNEIVFVECFVWKVCGELNVCWNAWTAGNDNARNARANAPRIVTVFHSVTVWQGLVYFLVIIEALVTLLPCLPPRRPLHCLALTAPPMCNVKHHLDIFHNNARWSLPKIPRRCPWQFNFSTIYPEKLIDQTYQTMTASHSRSIFPK